MTGCCIAAGRTETGHVRRHNEDAILVSTNTGVWAVADGLGGHAAGDVASALVVESLRLLPPLRDLCDGMDAVDDALLAVNHQLRLLARDQQVDAVASTVVVLLHTPEMVAVGWVGDSRAYVFEDGRLLQVSHDHVHGQRDDQTRLGTSPQSPSGVLTRAVGAEEHLYVDWAVRARRAGCAFLLCSDGINKELDDEDIQAHCQRASHPSTLVDALVATALGRAGRDNVSAVAIRLDEFEDVLR